MHRNRLCIFLVLLSMLILINKNRKEDNSIDFDDIVKKAMAKKENEPDPIEEMKMERKKRQEGLREIEKKYGIEVKEGYGSKRYNFD